LDPATSAGKPQAALHFNANQRWRTKPAISVAGSGFRQATEKKDLRPTVTQGLVPPYGYS
jgi:hypothetical protein